MTKKPNWKPYMKRYKRYNELSDRERKEFLRRILVNSQSSNDQTMTNRFVGIIEEDNKDEEF